MAANTKPNPFLIHTALSKKKFYSKKEAEHLHFTDFDTFEKDFSVLPSHSFRKFSITL